VTETDHLDAGGKDERIILIWIFRYRAGELG
jgi:hypothetical protein